MIKRVLVCGSRKFNNLQLMLDTFKGMDFDEQTTLISGMAKGADNMALNPELVIAFWDGVSHGTAHMIEIAKKADIPVIIIT